MLAVLVEGNKVWISQSRCGYRGPAVLMSNVFGSTWMVKACKGDDEKLFVVSAEFIEPFIERSEEEEISHQEKREIKRKEKEERKGHRPVSTRGRR